MSKNTKNAEKKDSKPETVPGTTMPVPVPLPSDGKQMTDAEFKAFLSRLSVSQLDAMREQRAKAEEDASKARSAALQSDAKVLCEKHKVSMETLARDIAGLAGLIVRTAGDGKKSPGRTLSENGRKLRVAIAQHYIDEAVKKVKRDSYDESAKGAITAVCGQYSITDPSEVTKVVSLVAQVRSKVKTAFNGDYSAFLKSIP